MKKTKLEKVFHEGKVGALHSGSKHGPVVKHGSKQEVAIALSEARKAGADVPPPHHSNPTEYWGPGEADGAVSDNAGPLQAIDPSEQMDQNVDGPDEFFCDWGNRPDLEWPGEKVRQRGRRQAY